ncbi:MAG: hypothetical protein B7Z55_19115, partial [Planctomycetales bacterium 12-60-4]
MLNGVDGVEGVEQTLIDVGGDPVVGGFATGAHEAGFGAEVAAAADFVRAGFGGDEGGGDAGGLEAAGGAGGGLFAVVPVFAAEAIGGGVDGAADGAVGIGVAGAIDVGDFVGDGGLHIFIAGDDNVSG